MNKFFCLCFFLFLSFSAFAQTRKPQPQRLSVVSRDFTITSYGAIGDGQVATDCSMTNGSAVLTCTTGRFAASDVGKVIAVYGAGMLRNGYRQPLATDGTYGWIVTRSGYAALPYSATASYSLFGTFARPTTDNGLVYQLISGSCANTPEPAWPTTLNATVTAGGCTWKAAANAARFTALR